MDGKPFLQKLLFVFLGVQCSFLKDQTGEKSAFLQLWVHESAQRRCARVSVSSRFEQERKESNESDCWIFFFFSVVALSLDGPFCLILSVHFFNER